MPQNSDAKVTEDEAAEMTDTRQGARYSLNCPIVVIDAPASIHSL